MSKWLSHEAEGLRQDLSVAESRLAELDKQLSERNAQIATSEQSHEESRAEYDHEVNSPHSCDCHLVQFGLQVLA